MKPFLTAQWRQLVMLNYEVAPETLLPIVPRGTELDFYKGRTFLSVVGFLFLDTRVLGLAIPFHRNFEEVNLRFYVRRDAHDGLRRGVVFVKELVPRRAIALTARLLYNENYVALPMSHRMETDESGALSSVEYAWRFGGGRQRMVFVPDGDMCSVSPGGEEEFITEHYWGYSTARRGETVEYQVEHPPWRVCRAREARLDCDVASLYGEQFAQPLAVEPSSAFLADGSKIKVHHGLRIGAHD